MAPPEVDPAIENALEKKEAHEPAASGLKAWTFKYGNYEGHIIAPNDYRGGAAFLPLVLLVPPAGGFPKQTKKKHGTALKGQLDLPLNCPMPCWYAYMDVPGNGHKAKVPREFIQFIKDLDDMCRSHKKNFKNLMFAWGLSRGARWLEEIVREHSKYLDVAFIIAGYPENRCRFKNSCAAKELIEVARKTDTMVVMVHFIFDEFCSVKKFPFWLCPQ